MFRFGTICTAKNEIITSLIWQNLPHMLCFKSKSSSSRWWIWSLSVWPDTAESFSLPSSVTIWTDLPEATAELSWAELSWAQWKKQNPSGNSNEWTPFIPSKKRYKPTKQCQETDLTSYALSDAHFNTPECACGPGCPPSVSINA